VNPCEATPNKQLIKELMDSRLPHSEHEWAARTKIKKLREALEVIAGPCEHFTKGSCFDAGKTVRARYGADAVCNACIANRALGRLP